MLDSGYQTALRLAQLARSRSVMELDAAAGQSDTAEAVLRNLQGFLDELRTEPAFRPRLGSALAGYATVAVGLGRREAAAAAWQEARGIYEDLLRGDSNNADLLSRVGECHQGLYEVDRLAGRLRQRGPARPARPRLLAALDRAVPADGPASSGRRRRSALAQNELHLGSLLSREGPSPERIRLLEAARTSCEKVRGAVPGDVVSRATLATCLSVLGDCYEAAGRWAEARQVLERTRGELEALLRINPGVDHYRESLAQCMATLAMVHRSEGHLNEALDACEHSSPIWEDLLRRDPSNLSFHWGLAQLLLARGGPGRDGAIGRSPPKLRNRRRPLCASEPGRDSQARLAGASYHVIGRLRNGPWPACRERLEAFRRRLKVRQLLCSRADNGPGDHSDAQGPGSGWARRSNGWAAMTRRSRPTGKRSFTRPRPAPARGLLEVCGISTVIAHALARLEANRGVAPGPDGTRP